MISSDLAEIGLTHLGVVEQTLGSIAQDDLAEPPSGAESHDLAYRCAMAGDLRVIEDGVDRHAETRRPPPPWMWIVVSLLIGIGFGVVFSTPSTTNPEAEATDVTVADFAPVGEVLGDGIGVAAAIPGFGDALVAVTRTGTQNVEHLLWPLAVDPVTRPLPVGAFGEASFDVTGTWLAFSTHVPDADGRVLSMGKPASLAPLSSDVTSFAWHDGTSGVLAYTQQLDGLWVLSVSQTTRETQIVASGEDVVALSGGEVAAWGDWGFAIQHESDQNESGSITLLTGNGELKTTLTGRVLDSNPSGWLVIYDGDLKLLAGGGLRSLNINWTSIGGVLAAALSPDGAQIALLGGSGLKITAIRGNTPTIEIPFTAPLSKVKWSSDSRFVVVPFLRGVIVADTVGGQNYEELTEHTVIEVSVIPLSP